MQFHELNNYLDSDKLRKKIKTIICKDNIDEEILRLKKLLKDAYSIFGDGDYHFISSPGRIEIGGNHTDHQHGHVLAAAINIDNLVITKKRYDNKVRYIDNNFGEINIDLNDLNIKEKEYNSSNSLVRGIAYKLNDLSYIIGGFDALCDSNVLIGSGISSSACFEVLLVEIFNHLYNEGKITQLERALISQYAEYNYFGKPSGLLDQTAISYGGFVAIDFYDINNPNIEHFDFSFSNYGYDLLLINTNDDHSNLSFEYALITKEMKEVAKELNVNYLAETNKNDLLNYMTIIRKRIKNDRAILRALHFFDEDKRAIKQKEAIVNKDINGLLKLINESGRSSFEYLQNVYVSSKHELQSLSLALYYADMILNDDGAYRVHGGGFAGTILLIVPKSKKEEIKKQMVSLFGGDCLFDIQIRSIGTTTIV